MSVTNGKISNRIGVVIAADGVSGDLQKVFGVAVQSKQWYFTDAAVNLWSKYKPFRNSSVFSDHYDDTNSARLAALKAANYGLSIVNCGSVDFPQKYTQAWGYLRARGTGYNEPQRTQDFEGYQHQVPWQLSTPGTGRLLYTIFNGMLDIPGTLVSALDTISFNMQCRENEDIDSCLDTLYPYDFQGAAKDFSGYYVGIAILDQNGAVWVISQPRVSDYFSGTQLYTLISAQIPSSIPNGAVKIAPVLTQNRETSWTNSYNGDIIILHGGYLSATKVAAAANLQTSVNISVGANSVTLTFSVTNNTGSAVTVNNMYAYLLSDGAYMNEHDSGYSGPDYQGEGANAFIKRTWPSSYQQTDIYSSDWIGGSTNPDQLAARAYNAYADFYAANGNSNVIGNNTTRTWSKTINHTDDDFGAYANGAWLLLCLSAGGNSFVREYNEIP